MTTRIGFAFAALAIAAGIGCRTPLEQRTYTRIPPRPSETTRLPELGADAEAKVGGSMISSVVKESRPAIKLADPITYENRLYESWFVLRIPRGTLYAAASDRAGTFYEAVEPIEYVQEDPTSGLKVTGDGVGPARKVRGGVFVPNAEPTATELYWIPTDDTPFNVPQAGIPFARVTVDLSSRRELVYAGASGSTIALTYREFVGDLATPTLSQELKLDLSKGDVLEPRGARIQVLSATEAGIRYRVLAHLK